MRLLPALLIVFTLCLPLHATDGKKAPDPKQQTDKVSAEDQKPEKQTPPEEKKNEAKWPFQGLQPGQEIQTHKVIILNLTDELAIPLMGIKKGKFQQGDNSGNADEKPSHTAEVKESFLLCQHEITRKEWRILSEEEPPGEGEDDQPVTGITWQQCIEVAKKWDKPAFRLRLPSETEWEYACRAEMTSKYFTGERMQRNSAVWAQGIQDGGAPQPIGNRKGNYYQLLDMAGNVYEWTEDVYDPKAYQKATGRSGGDAADEGRHVVRGGSFRTNMSALRSAARQARTDDDELNDVGVRFVVIPKMPKENGTDNEFGDEDEKVPETREGLLKGLKEKFGVTPTGNFNLEGLKMSYETLQKLPAAFRGRTDKINFAGNRGSVAGWVSMPQKTVNLAPSGISPYVLVHEMAHTWQGGNQDALNEWSAKFWGSSARNVRTGSHPQGKKSVSSYGNTNPWEDMAESVAHYVSDGARMKSTHPDRYEFVQQKIFSGTEYL